MKKIILSVVLVFVMFFALSAINGVPVEAQISPVPCYQFSVNLGIGSRGPDVVALQTLLIAQGFRIPSVEAGFTQKGYYGVETQNAVKKYQTSKGIESTGTVGPLTRVALNNCSNELNQNAVNPAVVKSAITITTVVPPSASSNVLVVVYGSNFAPEGNTAFFSCPLTNGSLVNSSISNISSNQGRVVYVTVPGVTNFRIPINSTIANPGNCFLTITNTNGASNKIPFTINFDTALTPVVRPELTLLSTATDVNGGPNSNDDIGLFSIKFRVTAIEGNIYVPTIASTATNFTVERNGLATTTKNISASLVDNTDTSLTQMGNYLVEEGESEDFTLTVAVPLGSGLNSGLYRTSLTGFKWSTVDRVSPSNVYTTNLDSFKTAYKVLN